MFLSLETFFDFCNTANKNLKKILYNNSNKLYNCITNNSQLISISYHKLYEETKYSKLF